MLCTSEPYNAKVNRLVESSKSDHEIKVHNFAVPGDTVQDNLSHRIKRFLASTSISDRNPSKEPLFDPSTTLYGMLYYSSPFSVKMPKGS